MRIDSWFINYKSENTCKKIWQKFMCVCAPAEGIKGVRCDGKIEARISVLVFCNKNVEKPLRLIHWDQLKALEKSVDKKWGSFLES